MIQVNDLVKRYGAFTAVNHIEFSVEKGQVMGFLGPNGAGKTTTMRILTGSLSATEGTARVAGFDVYQDPLEVKRRVGYLPETPPLYFDMRVDEYITFACRIKQVPKNKMKSAIDSALQKCGIENVQKRLIGKLSKGYKQRVGLAQAIVHDPDVLILDEPTVGLDPNQIIEIRNLIKGLAGDHTVILSTHILPEVTATCDEIVIINEGKIVAKDSYENLALRSEGVLGIHVRVLDSKKIDQKKLQSLQGVQSVTLHEGANSLEVECNSEHESCARLSSAIVESGAGLLEFLVKRESLEDIFRKLTLEDSGTEGLK
jgi:ABC-2 type transport system ATP-binding protein